MVPGRVGNLDKNPSLEGACGFSLKAKDGSRLFLVYPWILPMRPSEVLRERIVAYGYIAVM